MSRARLVLALLLLAACTAVPGERTFTAGDVTVVDVAGLVAGVELVDHPDVGGATEPSARKGNSFTQAVIAWTGSSCVTGWTLTLAGNALEVVIEADGEVAGCSGTLAYRAVALDLNRVVDAEAIDVTLADGS